MPNVMKLSMLTIAILGSQFALANEPWSQDRQWLLGDWNGKRQQLEQQGYKFTASIMSQAATNLEGGYNDSNTFENAAQLSLGANFDLEKIAGWKDTTASLVVTKRDGNALTLERIKDPRSSQLGNAQEIYGRGKIWRLSQAWVKKGFVDNTVQVKFGRMGMSEDFNSSQCEFQNLLLCGGQLGKSIGSIWYNSPVGVWAANVKYQFAPEWTLGVGVYEVNPDNIKTESNSDGFNLDMNNVKGATIPVELAWKPKLAAFNGLPGEYKVGALYSTAEANDIKTAGKVHDGKQSFWINAQQQLSHAGQDPKRGLYVSFNGVVNDKATTFVQSTQQLALWYKGPFDSRPNDSIGFGIIANYVVNDRAKDKQIATNESRGYYSYDPIASDYIPIQDDELNVELNYTYQWSPAVMLRPNIQYIHQPAGVKEVDDAWVAGLSVKVNF